MIELSYADFERWAGTLNVAPTAAMIRRRYGCSNATSTCYLERLHGMTPRARGHIEMRTCMDRVFAHLVGAPEPATVGQVAGALGITAEAAMHALQNLHEASRLVRNSHVKPFTYFLPKLNLALAQWPAPADTAIAAANRLGTLVGRLPELAERIAA